MGKFFFFFFVRRKKLVIVEREGEKRSTNFNFICLLIKFCFLAVLFFINLDSSAIKVQIQFIGRSAQKHNNIIIYLFFSI